MQRKLNTVVKDCGTVGNKVDSGKSKLTAVKARVLKLENKKWDKEEDQDKTPNSSCGTVGGIIQDKEGDGEVQQDNVQELFLVRPSRATESGILPSRKKIVFCSGSLLQQ